MTVPGLGGQQPPPQNSAPAGQLVPGITPGTTGQIIANRVIIIGANGELLIYNPTPAAGNLLVSIAGVAGTDPYGNTVEDGVTIYHGTADMQMHVNQTANVPAVEMPTGVASEQEHASIYTIPTNTGLANEFIELNVIGPGSTFDGSTPTIVLASAEANGAVPANLQFQVPGGTNVFYVYSNGVHFNQPLYGVGGVLTIGDTITVDGSVFNSTSLAFLAGLTRMINFGTGLPGSATLAQVIARLNAVTNGLEGNGFTA